MGRRNPSHDDKNLALRLQFVGLGVRSSDGGGDQPPKHYGKLRSTLGRNRLCSAAERQREIEDCSHDLAFLCNVGGVVFPNFDLVLVRGCG